MASFFAAGTHIEIMKTDNVTSRFPELVGALGVVDMAPIHPSTWFTIKVVDSGRLVKLQTTAMKPLGNEKVQFPNNGEQESPEKLDEMSPQILESPLEHIEQRPRSFSNVGIAHFTKGVAVKILGTNNVMQRVPHLVGMVGHIKDVPIHPITWFKIEFPSGQVVTFRPSAFKLDDGRDDVFIPKPVKRSVAHTVDVKKIHPVAKEKEHDSDFAVGLRVRIRSGELSGAVGEIMRFGNGWIQVLTSEGKIAKRAHELDFIGSARSSGKFAGADSSICQKDFALESPAGDEIRRSKSGRVIRSHPQYFTAADSESDNYDTFQHGKRLRSNSDLESIEANSMEKASGHSHMRTNRNKESHFPSLRALKCDRLYLEHESSDCPFPLIAPQLRQARWISTQEYVDRESSYNTGRPDLSYWVDQFREAFSHKEEVMDISDGVVNDRTRNSNNSSREDIVNIVDQRNLDRTPTTSSSMITLNSPRNQTPSESIVNRTFGYVYAPQPQYRQRSESLCETDCEDNMSPDLLALSGSLSQHQKEPIPSMPTPMLLPPHANHSSSNSLSLSLSQSQSQPVVAESVDDTALVDPGPARFFLSRSPREPITSHSSQEVESERDMIDTIPVPDVRRGHTEWTTFFSSLATQQLVTNNADTHNNRQYPEMSTDNA